VDGFDEDESEYESDEGAEVSVRLLAAERDPLEAFELADQLLDARSGAIERFRKEGWPVPGRRLGGDHRADASLTRRGTVALGIVAFIADRRARRDVGSDLEQDRELAAV
jgi:hypothetical protein